MRNNAPRVRFDLVATVMIGILAVSVALAWLTTRPEEQPRLGGVEIISKLADDTLDEYWPDSHSDSWFIVLEPSRTPIGWQMLSRDRQSDGSFSGSFVNNSGDDLQHRSTWKISADLSEGLYVASGPDSKGRQTETRITLSADKITVVRSSGGKELTASAPRPDNYVPEGAFPLVLRLVATRGKEATVKMIFDEMAILHGAVNFVNARLIPRGGNIVNVDYFGRGPMFSVVYQLDEVRDIARYEYPGQGIIHLRCEKELIMRSFRIHESGPALKAHP